MNAFDIRQFFFWYGPPELKIDINLPVPWQEFSEILSNFKSGNFHERERLLDLCCRYRDEKIGIFGLQLFFSVARPHDLKILDRYTQSASDEELKTIAVFSIKSMIGVSLAKWFVSVVDKIASHEIKSNMGDQLMGLLSKEQRADFGYHAPILKILDAIERYTPPDTQFIFAGKPAFLGDIAIRMQLLMQVALSIQPPAILGDGTGPTLLSAATGIECPVSYTTVMSLDKVKLVLDYVKAVSAMGKAIGGWKRGSKYFYGHEIV